MLGPAVIVALSENPFLQITQKMSTIKKKKKRHFKELSMSETVLTFKNFFTQHENGYKCYKEGSIRMPNLISIERGRQGGDLSSWDLASWKKQH